MMDKLRKDRPREAVWLPDDSVSLGPQRLTD